MSRAVLDASALLALLLEEPGAPVVQAALGEAVIGAVNLAEVVSHYSRHGAGRADIEAMLRPLALEVAPADEALSVEAGMMRRPTLAEGLSLGDRYCLALARRERVRAVTADRRWLKCADAIGVEVELIR